MGYAVMGTATAKGEDRATAAAQAAIASPLLEAGAIDGARGILINITGSSSLRLAEVNEASTIIQSAAHEDANIIFGAVLDEKMKDEVKITVIATGFKEVRQRREHSESAAALHSARAATTACMRPTKFLWCASLSRHRARPEPQATNRRRKPERPRSDFVRSRQPRRHRLRDCASCRAGGGVTDCNGRSWQSEPIETISSSVEINYDSDDLEIPAFLRKRAEG